MGGIDLKGWQDQFLASCVQLNPPDSAGWLPCDVPRERRRVVEAGSGQSVSPSLSRNLRRSGASPTEPAGHERPRGATAHAGGRLADNSAILGCPHPAARRSPDRCA